MLTSLTERRGDRQSLYHVDVTKQTESLYHGDVTKQRACIMLTSSKQRQGDRQRGLYHINVTKTERQGDRQRACTTVVLPNSAARPLPPPSPVPHPAADQAADRSATVQVAAGCSRQSLGSSWCVRMRDAGGLHMRQLSPTSGDDDDDDDDKGRCLEGRREEDRTGR